MHEGAAVRLVEGKPAPIEIIAGSGEIQESGESERAVLQRVHVLVPAEEGTLGTIYNERGVGSGGW